MVNRNAPPPAPDTYESIRRAIRADQKDTAREMLRPILTSKPTAEAWFLAAQIASNQAQSINFLRRALALDANHAAARSALTLLEGTKQSVTTVPNLLSEDGKTMAAGSKAFGRQNAPSTNWSRIGCAGFFLVLILVFAAFILDAVGAYQGLITGITLISGGPTPVSSLNGTALAQVEGAAAIVPASQSKPASSRDADVIENGYLHEYRFIATTPQDIAVNVQFYSLAAKRVSHNLAVVAPDGTDIFPRCTTITASPDDSSVNVTCHVINPGTYLVRVLGRSGESVGTYTISVQRAE